MVRAPSRGTENRTLLSRLKAGCFAKKLYPHGQWGMRFKRIRVSISSLLFQSVVALRIELSAARLSAEHGLPALDDRRFLSRAHRGRTDYLSASGAPTPKAGVLGHRP